MQRILRAIVDQTSNHRPSGASYEARNEHGGTIANAPKSQFVDSTAGIVANILGDRGDMDRLITTAVAYRLLSCQLVTRAAR